MKSNNNRLWWAIILLGVLNITTISTIIYHNYKESRESGEVMVIEEGAKPITGRYVRQELGFDSRQMEEYRDINGLFHRRADGIVRQINELKMEMFDELQSRSSDSVKLSRISSEIGDMHKELKDATIKFYLSLKEICDEDQQIRLRELFIPLFTDRGLNRGDRRRGMDDSIGMRRGNRGVGSAANGRGRHNEE